MLSGMSTYVLFLCCPPSALGLALYILGQVKDRALSARVTHQGYLKNPGSVFKFKVNFALESFKSQVHFLKILFFHLLVFVKFLYC